MRMQNVNRILVARRKARRRRAPRLTFGQADVAANVGLQPIKAIASLAGDSRLAASTQWTLAMSRPGVIETPYVVDGQIRSDINTSIASVSQLITVDTSATPNNYFLVLWSPVLGSTSFANSGLYWSALAPATTVGAGALTACAATATIYSNVTGWTDKFFTFGGTIDVTCRSPAANVSGSVWLGALTYAQLAANAQGTTELRSRGYELDLKNGTSFSLKCGIQNASLVDAQPGAVLGDGLYQDEMISYALFSPATFQSTTAGTVMPWQLDMSINVNFAWVPDSSTPVMAKMVMRHPVSEKPPKPAEKEFADELDELVSRSPVPVSNPVVLERVVADIAAGVNPSPPPPPPGLRVPNMSGPDILTPDHRGGLSAEVLARGLSRLRPVGSYESGSPMVNPFFTPEHAGGMLRASLTSACELPHIIDYVTPSVWLEWTASKEVRRFDSDSWDPETAELWEMMLDLKDQLLEKFKERAQFEDTLRDLIKTSETKTEYKSGKSSIKYKFEGEYKDFSYIRARLTARAEKIAALAATDPALACRDLLSSLPKEETTRKGAATTLYRYDGAWLTSQEVETEFKKKTAFESSKAFMSIDSERPDDLETIRSESPRESRTNSKKKTQDKPSLKTTFNQK